MKIQILKAIFPTSEVSADFTSSSNWTFPWNGPSSMRHWARWSIDSTDQLEWIETQQQCENLLKKIDYYLQKSRVCRALPSVDFLKGAITEELESRTGTNGGENPALGTLDAHTWFITHLLLPFAFFKTKLCCFCLTIIRVCKRNSLKQFLEMTKNVSFLKVTFKYCESDLLDLVISIFGQWWSLKISSID